jgi:amino acid transporter
MGIVIVLIILALIFGVGSVLEGLAWGFLIVAGLVTAAAVLGYRKMSSTSRT